MDLLLELMVALSEALFENYQTKKKGQVFWVQDRCIPEFFPMLKITTVPVYPMIWDTGIFALQF